MYLISDNNETVIGMRLAGIKGEIIDDKIALKKAIDKVLKNKNIAILLVTEKAANMLPEYINEIRISLSLPLLITIPDRHGTKKSADYITKNIKEAIGIKI